MTKNPYKFYVGIDVAKMKLDVAQSKNNELFQATNDENGFKELVKKLPSKKVTLIVMEASGGYEKSLVTFLQKKKYHVAVVNAKRVRDFAKASGKLAKTDSIDSTVIMTFGKAFNPTPQSESSLEQKERLSYLNRRTQLVLMIATEKQHLEQSPKELHTQIKKHIEYLKKSLDKVEKTLLNSIRKDSTLKDKFERLTAIKGVGYVTAINVLLHMPELGELTSKEVASLTGVAPFNRDSGQMKGKREIWGGRAPVRTALYMAIVSGIRTNPIIKKFYDGLINRGKLRKVAMVACMRKLITIMNAMIRDGSIWQPNS